MSRDPLQATGIGLPPELVDEIDRVRETDESHPDHISKNAFMWRCLAIGLCVHKHLEAFGWETDELSARNTVRQALLEQHRAETGSESVPGNIEFRPSPYRR